MKDDNAFQTSKHTTKTDNLDEIPEEDQWKFKEPYRIHDSGENFKAIYNGACHCGQIQFGLSREKPLAVKFCHCSDCQIQHGGMFQWAAIFHKADINFTSGFDGLEWYDPGSKKVMHKLPCKVRCSHCHSPIMDEGRNMILLMPSLLKLEDEEARKKFKPECHMFYPQRVVDIPDGLPKWTGINEQSDLCEDSPPEAVRELERKRMREKAENGDSGEHGQNGEKGKNQ